jgi:hypothetical protein
MHLTWNHQNILDMKGKIDSYNNDGGLQRPHFLQGKDHRESQQRKICIPSK